MERTGFHNVASALCKNVSSQVPTRPRTRALPFRNLKDWYFGIYLPTHIDRLTGKQDAVSERVTRRPWSESRKAQAKLTQSQINVYHSLTHYLPRDIVVAPGNQMRRPDKIIVIKLLCMIVMYDCDVRMYVQW